MSGFYGTVALLLPGKLEEQAAVAGLRRAAQALDEAFIEIPEWIENRPPVPERIIGVQPDGSPWMTCLDPICNEGLESDIALGRPSARRPFLFQWQMVASCWSWAALSPGALVAGTPEGLWPLCCFMRSIWPSADFHGRPAV